jgi:hypothetical protein
VGRGSGSASAATRAWCMVRSALADDDEDVEDAAATNDGVEVLPRKAKDVVSDRHEGHAFTLAQYANPM